MGGIKINFRPHGRETERAGADAVAPRRMSQRFRLLPQFMGKPKGLTDVEAAEMAGLEDSEYSKRCGELRDLGYITPMYVGGHLLTRPGKAGVRRMVSFITPEGEAMVRELEQL